MPLKNELYKIGFSQNFCFGVISILFILGCMQTYVGLF